MDGKFPLGTNQFQQHWSSKQPKSSGYLIAVDHVLNASWFHPITIPRGDGKTIWLHDAGIEPWPIAQQGFSSLVKKIFKCRARAWVSQLGQRPSGTGRGGGEVVRETSSWSRGPGFEPTRLFPLLLLPTAVSSNGSLKRSTPWLLSHIIALDMFP